MFLKDSNILQKIEDDRTNKYVCSIEIGEKFNESINLLFRNRHELMASVDKMIADMISKRLNVSGSFPVASPVIGKNYVFNGELYKLKGHYPLKKMVVSIRNVYLLFDDGTMKVVGYNGYGHCTGDNTTTRVDYWKDFPGQLSSGVKIADVWAWNYDTYIKGTDGAIYAFGRNNTGALGLGNTTNTKVPTKITFAFPSEVVDMKFCGGVDYTTAWFICKNGEVYCSGNNDNGQFGNGTNTVSNVPYNMTTFFTSRVVEIASGSYTTTGGNTMYRCEDGAIFVTGYNNVGQLGDGTTATKNVLAPIKLSLPTNSKVTGMAVGGGVSSVIVNKTEIWSCGYGGTGAKGDGVTSNSSSFAKIIDFGIPIKKLLHYASVAGEAFSVCLLENGQVWTCGYNGNGQLGLKHSTNQTYWTKIDVMDKIIDFGLSYRGLHMLTENYEIQIYGNNDQCQLGDGTTIVNNMATRSASIVIRPVAKSNYNEPDSDFQQIL